MNRLEVFISQLDGLVVFLASSRREVFDTIKNHESVWFPESQDPRLPDTFESYRMTVANAAFLLGYAYFETFLSDHRFGIVARSFARTIWEDAKRRHLQENG